MRGGILSRTPEYRAVSNFFRNTQKLTPEELKTVVKEVIKEEVAKALKDYTMTNMFSRMVRDDIKTQHWTSINMAIKNAAQEIFNKHFDLTITKKDIQ